jgi:hypothetical protein
MIDAKEKREKAVILVQRFDWLLLMQNQDQQKLKWREAVEDAKGDVFTAMFELEEIMQ